ncbi:MAG: threonylcarbamoyl-AMP synthase [Eudoraea sp.]|nr:threonylcarbamoyl-AMP synthase [Eudoraea sp.]
MNAFTTEITNALATLEAGGLILYPTDTVWGIGCDATDPEAVAKVYALKQRNDTKALICLVANEVMLERHVESVPETAWDIIELAQKPTTLVYDRPTGLAENLVASDNTIAIRVASDPFCKQLIQRFRKPIVSTSANLADKPTPKSFKEVEDPILKGVDYIVLLEQEKRMDTASAIIKLGNDGTVRVIRQ